MMNRNRFNAPPLDDRVAQGMFSTPPPNFNWQGPPAPNEFAMQGNTPAFQNPSAPPVFNVNPPKKSYCKSCNLWHSEPYEFHLNSAQHLQSQKSNNRNLTHQNELFPPPEQLMSINCSSFSNIQQFDYNNDASFPPQRKMLTRPNDVSYETNNNNNANLNNNSSTFPISRKNLPRKNEPSFDPNKFQLSRKAPMRTNSQSHEALNQAPLPVPRKGIARVAIPPFKMTSPLNPIDNLSEKNKNVKSITNLPNPASFNQNNFQGSHATEGQCFDKKFANKRIDDTIKIKPSSDSITVSTPITSNKGREMLIPVSGVYCTLCEEFFRNTDTAETIHCKSSQHIDAYEKLVAKQKQQVGEKRPILESNSESRQVNIKRSKLTPKQIKSTKSVNKTPVAVDKINKKDTDPVGVRDPVTSGRNSLECDQTSSSEFQGPDFSLEFPDEAEDYDE